MSKSYHKLNDRIEKLFSTPEFATLIFGFILITFGYTESTAQNLSFNNIVAADMMVCEDAEMFTIEFTNTSAQTLSDVSVMLNFPSGVEYVEESLVESTALNVQEEDINNLSAVSFSMNDLPSGATVSFTLLAAANFDAYNGQLNGDIFSNQVTVNYAGGSETETTDTYNILYPALSITQVDPMAADVFVGQTFTRNVTVVNGGYGSVSSFAIKNTYGPDINLDAVSIGTLNAAKDEITFTTDDFIAFGNGDGRLDQNEMLTFTQTITAIGCNSTQDELTAYWGCAGQTAESNTKYPYTTINLFPPNLNVTAQGSFGTCVDGSADLQQLTMTNNGTGPANATEVIIKPQYQNQYTRTDATSITYTLNGNTFSLTPIQTQEASTYGCLGADPIDGFTVSLPAIQPGETLYLNWDNYTCATASCGLVRYAGWDYEGTYTDMCDSKQYTFDGMGQSEIVKKMSTFYESPSDLSDNQKGTYTLNINSATFKMPEGSNPYFEAVFNIPTGLVWSGIATDLKYISDTEEWTANQVNYDANTKVLTARYDLPIPTDFNLNHSRFDVDLTADCSANVNWVTVGMQLFYYMDTNCGTPYKVNMTCKETPMTQLHCPSPCPHGLAFQSFEIERTSFGKSDNDQNGLPDAANNLDMSKVKMNRMMYSDTFETIFKGQILTSATKPFWSYGYAKSNIPDGAHIAIQSARVNIVDKSTGQTLTCDNVPFTESLSGGVRTVDFDFSPLTLVLNGCFNFAGFVLENEDEVELIATYKVIGNPGGSAEQQMITNEFYVSDLPFGTKYQCNDWNGNFTLIGYYFYTNWSQQYNIKTCTETIVQSYFMSIGDCCTNYAGGNLFPYEYRNWANVKDLSVEIPAGYSFVSGYVDQFRTKRTNQSITETATITPTSIDGTTHYFDLESYFVENGGTLNLSDDGFSGNVYIEVQPECTVNQAANNAMSWSFNFRKNEVMGGNITEAYEGGSDYLKYYRADLSVATTLATQEGIASTVSWDISVNNANAFAANAWFYIENLSGNITIEEVMDLSNNNVLTDINNFYQLGDRTNGQNGNYRITASYNSCALSEISIITGYSCDGYPTDLASYNCAYDEIDLFIAPQPSELQIRFNSFINPIDECDNSIGIELEMLSAKLANVEDLFVNVIQPATQTVTINPGSVQVLYPAGGVYTTITDPILQEDTYAITASDLHPTIGTNGLVGVTDITSNLVKVKFDLILDNDYKPGEIINFEIGGKRPCGNNLPTLALAFDPNATFEKPENIGLGEVSDAWASAWGDYDNDGNVDLFVTNYSEETPNYLYHNNGDETFSVVTTGPIATDLASSLAATWGDYDNDGDLDLYVANNIGYANFLYRNDGGNFTKILNDPMVTDKSYSHGVSWADYDNDGYLDMFVADYFSTKFNQLFHNNGDGTFTEANSAAPTLEASFSVSGAWGDYNNDGYVDLFVSNTEGNKNSLYKNMGNGSFLKINTGDIVNDLGNSVGASWGDYDNDGDLDLFVSNAGNQNNCLYQNNGDETFTKITTGAIVNDGGHSHGSAWADYDNDGDLDLFVSNDQNQNNFLYANNGDGTFTSITNDITQDGGQSFGAAWADYDNDGDVDLFIANHKLNENFIYKNSRGRCQSKGCVLLVGTNSNRSAIGTKIRMKANIYGKDVWQMREITSQSGGGIGGQSELKQIIGLGDATVIDSIIIDWNSGYQQIITNQIPDNCLTITEESGSEVCGVVYYDENNNCVQDADELGIPNITLEIQPSGQSVITDENGAYVAYLGVGSYTIEQETEGTNWNPTCTIQQEIEVTEIGSTLCGNNFANTASCTFADLQVEISTTAHRVGFENLIALTYKNIGPATATDVKLTVQFGEYVLPIQSSIPWDEETGTDCSWNLGDVPMGTSVTIYIKDEVSANATIGEDITLTATISGASEDDCNVADNSFVDVQEAVGAIDPNDILVSPEGYIENDQELVYKIRFQNIGNATVSTVRIEDQLPEALDLSTLQIGLASHNYSFEIQDDRRLVWTFENINMPDSLTNEPESHGFVIFKIKPKQGLENGVEIPNNALIFFDNVAPLETNTVVNIIGKPKAVIVEAGQLQIFPNPMQSESNIKIIPFTGPDVNIQSISVYDMLGNEIYREVGVAKAQLILQRRNLITGYYMIIVRGDDGKEYAGKILVN